MLKVTIRKSFDFSDLTPNRVDSFEITEYKWGYGFSKMTIDGQELDQDEIQHIDENYPNFLEEKIAEMQGR